MLFTLFPPYLKWEIITTLVLFLYLETFYAWIFVEKPEKNVYYGKTSIILAISQSQTTNIFDTIAS